MLIDLTESQLEILEDLVNTKYKQLEVNILEKHRQIRYELAFDVEKLKTQLTHIEIYLSDIKKLLDIIQNQLYGEDD